MESLEEQYNVQRIECMYDIGCANNVYIGARDGEERNIVFWKYRSDVVEVSGDIVLRNCLLVVPPGKKVLVECNTLRIEGTVFRDRSVMDYSCSGLIIKDCKMRTLKGILEDRKLHIVEMRDCTVTEKCTFEDLGLDGGRMFLQSIVVSNCGLTGSVYVNYEYLRTLDLSHNELTEFKGGKHLSGLKKLNLSHNRLKYIDDRYLCKMESLKHINLSHNELTDIDPLDTTYELKYLKSIDVSYNKIRETPISALHRRYLKVLKLEGNPIQKSINIYTRCSRTRLTVSISEGVYYCKPFTLVKQKGDVLYIEYEDDDF